MVITPATKLDAVNELLASVGSSPVNTLDDDLSVDVITATRVIDSVSKEVQSRGWSFNTLNSVTLPSDAETGYVACPNNFIRFFSTSYQLIRRNGYFYDLATDSNEFVGGLSLTELVKEVEFEELPDVFRHYITCRSARIFQVRMLNSPELDSALRADENDAYTQIINYDLMQGNYNIYNDDSTISQLIQRS